LGKFCISAPEKTVDKKNNTAYDNFQDFIRSLGNLRFGRRIKVTEGLIKHGSGIGNPDRTAYGTDKQKKEEKYYEEI